MDKKTQVTLTFAKYMAYAGLLIGILSVGGPDGLAALFLGVLLLTSGSIRQFHIYDTPHQRYLPCFFIFDALLIAALGRMGYQGLDVVIYFLIISESTMTVSPRFGGTMIGISLMGTLLVLYPIFERYGLRAFMFNLGLSLAGFVFAYAISLISRRQIEQSAALQAALTELDKSKQELETTHQELIASQQRMREIAVLEERNRMAREIHDSLAHSLTAMIVTMEAAKKLIKKGKSDVTPLLDKAQEQARYGLNEVRLSIKHLRGEALRETGVRRAVEEAISHLAAAGETRFELHIAENLSLSEEQEMAVFRVIQEAATNAIRHGEASLVQIALEQGESGLVLSIEDNGCGTDGVKEGNGLTGMRERAAALGGRLLVDSSPGTGFRLQLLLPSNVGGGTN